MIFFIIYRFILLILTLFFLTIISFLINYFYSDLILNKSSIINDYIYYFHKLNNFDFGISKINNLSIKLQLIKYIPYTVKLCTIVFFISLIIGIPIGIIIGIKKSKWKNISINIIELLILSIPIYFFSILVILFFYLHSNFDFIIQKSILVNDTKNISNFYKINIFLFNLYYNKDSFTSIINNFIFPIITLTIIPITEVIRLVRIKTIKIVNCNYILIVKNRGLSNLTIVFRHLLHNILPPIIPKLCLQFSSIMMLSVTNEIIFKLPGLGYWIINSVWNHDYVSISASIIIIGSLITCINFIIDIIDALINKLHYNM